jgi:hypothetical protein
MGGGDSWAKRILSVAGIACVLLAAAAGAAYTQSVQQCVVDRHRMTELDVRPRTDADTIVVIQLPNPAPGGGGVAEDLFTVRHARFEFRGQPYFLAYPGLNRWQVPGAPGRTTPARLVPVGEHAGVTLYTWEPVREGIIYILFVRMDTCRLQQYWHVTQVRDAGGADE